MCVFSADRCRFSVSCVISFFVSSNRNKDFPQCAREGATAHCIQTWISLPLDQNTVPRVVLTGRAFSPPPSQPASLLAEAAASSRGNLLQAPSLIITELLPSDSLGSFLSLPLHVCPLIQPTSRAAVSQHLSQMEDSSSLQSLLRVGRHYSDTMNLLFFCTLIHSHLFPSCRSFFSC